MNLLKLKFYYNLEINIAIRISQNNLEFVKVSQNFFFSKNHSKNRHLNIQQYPRNCNQLEGVIVEVQHCHQDWELFYHYSFSRDLFRKI